MSALGLFLAVAGGLLVWWALGAQTFGLSSAPAIQHPATGNQA